MVFLIARARWTLAAALVLAAGAASSGCSLLFGFSYQVAVDAGLDAGAVDAHARDAGANDANERDSGDLDADVDAALDVDAGVDAAPSDAGLDARDVGTDAATPCAAEGTPFEIVDTFPIGVDPRTWDTDPASSLWARGASPGLQLFVPIGQPVTLASLIRSRGARDLSGRDVIVHVSDLSPVEVEARLLVVGAGGDTAAFVQRAGMLTPRAYEGADFIGPTTTTTAGWWRIRHRCASPSGVDAGGLADAHFSFAVSDDGVTWTDLWTVRHDGDFGAAHVDFTLAVTAATTTDERHVTLHSVGPP